MSMSVDTDLGFKILTAITVIVVVGAIVLVSDYLRLPSSVLGSFALTAYMAAFTFKKYSVLSQPQRVLVVGLTIASLIVFVLFGGKHYVFEFTFTVAHIAGIIAVPFIVFWYFERKASKNTGVKT